MASGFAWVWAVRSDWMGVIESELPGTALGGRGDLAALSRDRGETAYLGAPCRHGGWHRVPIPSSDPACAVERLAGKVRGCCGGDDG